MGLPNLTELTIPNVELSHHYLATERGQVHYVTAGNNDNPALLLVHGFPQHWWAWHQVIADLSADYFLICPDLRGHGWTEDGNKDSVRKQAMAADLLAILAAENVDKIAICAHDWGGYASQIAALMQPEQVAGMLLLSIPYIGGAKPNPPLKSALRMHYQLLLSLPFSEKIYPQVLAKGVYQDVQQKARMQAANMRQYTEQYLEPSRGRLGKQIYRTFISGDASHILKWAAKQPKPSFPAKFILSAHDAYIPPEMVSGADRFTTNCTAELQDRTGHFVVEEDPDFVIAQIREFLAPLAVPVKPLKS